MRTRPSRPAPPPLQVDTRRVVLVGAALWVAALVVVLLLGDRADPRWIWTCLAGIALALIGLGIMRWQGQLEEPSASRRSRARGGTSRRGRSTTDGQRTSKSEVS